jgi:hypothetical protein
MAYSSTNPPHLLMQRIGGGAATWAYSSSDPTGTVDGAGYFTDGLARGMKVNDMVQVTDTVNSLISNLRVAAVTSTGADLGTGISIGSSANAD